MYRALMLHRKCLITYYYALDCLYVVMLRVQIQGSIMTAATLEVLIGLTGAIGFLTRYIGPLSICPTVSLLGTWTSPVFGHTINIHFVPVKPHRDP